MRITPRSIGECGDDEDGSGRGEPAKPLPKLGEPVVPVDEVPPSSEDADRDEHRCEQEDLAAPE